jgi:NAD(P)-dependent dehydrogenase (short-subunit alcohol dehydrogenase family)
VSPSADLGGRTFLVTGANTGIGRATAVALARRGGRVHLACRSEEKARPALDVIAEHAADAEFLPLDLADLSSVRTSAEQFLARDEPLHVLVNNAGVAGQRGRTADGFELAFGVNHLGHFLLTTLLLDRLQESGPARIVNLSSDSHFQAKGIDYDALRRPTRGVTGMSEYAVSKLANVLFTQELARRLDSTGVTAYALHPGVIASDIWRRVPFPFDRLMKIFMKSTEEGAQTSLYCATAPELADVSGRYYDSCRERPASAVATPALAAELWSRSEQWVAQ